MIYKAQSPAGFAEEYIVESIWSGRFPPGTILPAERELSELIGVTRTTLREVLQRLARDGWLTIQHGKPTKVNNFWESCGLNILETLARLDQEGIPELVDNLLAARTNLSAVFIRGAIRHNPEESATIIARYKEVEEDGMAFAQFDYQMTHDLALASNNNVFVLMMNGFRGLYSRIGGFYFSHPQARNVAKAYYANLLEAAEKGEYDSVPVIVRNYGIESGKVWQEVRDSMPNDLVD
ncbi:MAG TPA: fatty acid metabolism transcriptional regulator FadR [Alteromonas australica]|jgi:GntR family transcriptional regulator, negative regulator for fad regulon and positive regulator of fabA|uniref:Fatty acid metabolism regulator protein n=1 Tax=Alteromonas australica TaxID=589873 RepID=A0A075P7U2_9ALTE|nr:MULTISPECIES: fatty acid metabolism transcriptional regulator FadR [Alteromonas]MAB93458.1 fatty acid metabolism transcriptional regulator FadR [Alteromonas sp.]AIF99372.1 fatty acid metabolism regulator [Alteromonas australica]AJP44396.1 fatty acid metabolism regulator [Alteromonas australica]MAF69683.1 fatty acid metabolism transcriptional regulator FadR [Alteromonas sp.]MAO31268.1 fatty acid metabolism transcriptional regulator FadR [Alteromonas sp.]|tara:strand:- start:242 stop:952 length:711 start_codon:yes stop_codon:yes gene_type:complete